MAPLLCLLAAAGAAALVVHLMRHLVCRPQRDLRGKVVLLTGSGGGLGRQLALQLARRGCPLALADVAEAPNEETASQVRSAAPQLQVRAYTVDLGGREQVAALVDRVLQDFGKVDILVSNAAILQGGGVCDYRDEDVDAMLHVNLRASILLVRALLPHMRDRGSGQIVAVSSAAGVVPNYAMSLYGATKAGLSHFMQCLYRELRQDGLEKDIIVTTIHPYFMSTFDLIVNASHVTGWLGRLAPFVAPSWAAQKAVESLARGDHYLFIPYYLQLPTTLVTLLPLCLRDFALEKLLILTFKYLPAYKYRHRARDIHLLHEFLVEGFEPFCDPEQLFQSMHEECVSAGQAPPHDFSAHRASLEHYYTSRRAPVPAVVAKYINKAG